jgi:hypothetical protein
LAIAAAIVPMCSLQRCTAILYLKEIKADRAGLSTSRSPLDCRFGAGGGDPSFERELLV